MKTGAATAQDWKPPDYSIEGSGPWPDWMSAWAPVWSDRAIAALGSLAAPHCQLIPWIHERDHCYSLVNVTTLLPHRNWSSQDSSRYGEEYASANIIDIHVDEVPDLFRLALYSGKTFVSDRFARAFLSSGLTGVAFVHPRVHQTDLVFRPIKFGRAGAGIVLEDAEIFR